MENLDGKVAVITGGGSERGIGRATGMLLAERGMKIVLADVNQDGLDAAVEALRSSGADAIGVQTDVSDFSSVKHLADAAYDHYGKVNVAFMNAGIGGGGSLFDDDDMDAWHRVIGVNFLGVLHGSKAFVSRMIESGEPGHFLGTSSGAGTTGTSHGGAGYAVTKQAVLTLLECLYGQLRDRGVPINVTCVLPQLAKTNLAGPDPEFMHMVEKGIQAGGIPAVLVEPEHVAQTVVEAILENSFWAHTTFEQDQRIHGGSLKSMLEWEHDMYQKTADAMINRKQPDQYLWGSG